MKANVPLKLKSLNDFELLFPEWIYKEADFCGLILVTNYTNLRSKI